MGRTFRRGVVFMVASALHIFRGGGASSARAASTVSLGGAGLPAVVSQPTHKPPQRIIVPRWRRGLARRCRRPLRSTRW